MVNSLEETRVYAEISNRTQRSAAKAIIDVLLCVSLRALRLSSMFNHQLKITDV